MRLVVSKKTDIAVRALKILAVDRNRTRSGAELSRELAAGPAHMSQALAPLVAQGWVISRPGPDGGYGIATGLTDLSVRQVLEAIEGPIEGTECVLQRGDCGAGEPCEMHSTWATARAALARSLDGISAV